MSNLIIDQKSVNVNWNNVESFIYILIKFCDIQSLKDFMKLAII